MNLKSARRILQFVLPVTLLITSCASGASAAGTADTSAAETSAAETSAAAATTPTSMRSPSCRPSTAICSAKASRFP